MSIVFNYYDPKDFLVDLWLGCKSKNERFSFRSFARYLGLTNHAPLHQMLLGKRKIAKSIVPKIIKKFNLSKVEAEYFSLLVEKSLSKNEREKSIIEERLLECIKIQGKFCPEVLISPQIQRDPIHFSILEMASPRPIPDNLVWIKNHLIKNYTEDEIKRALNSLFQANMIAKNDKGDIYRTKENFIYSKQDEVDLNVRKYISILCDMAKDSLDTQPLSKRECSSIMFNIDPKNLPEIKNEIRIFMRELLCKYETPHSAVGQVYNLNSHFFPITKEQ